MPRWKEKRREGINAVIMGRKTFEYMLNNSFLWDRINVIVTQRKEDEYNQMIIDNGWRNVLTARSLDEALEKLTHPIIDEVFVIGGKSLLEEGLKKK